MGYITISKKEDGVLKYKLRIPSLESITLQGDYPIEANPLPESDDRSQILIKILGNSSTIDLSFKAVKLTIGLLPSDTYVPEVVGTDTGPKLVRFLMDKFQPKSLTDSYAFYIRGDLDENNPAGINTTDYSVTGYIRKVSCSLSPREGPDVYTVNINFIIGQSIEDIEEADEKEQFT